jgi:hypothetical protein
MGERSVDIEREIQRQRNDLNVSMRSLQRKAVQATDWRCQFEKRPFVMMGLAFGGGVLLSALAGGRHRARSVAARADQSISLGGLVSGQAKAANGQFAAMRTDAWDALKSTVIGLAAARVGSTVEAFLPGFQAEYKKAAAGRP